MGIKDVESIQVPLFSDQVPLDFVEIDKRALTEHPAASHADSETRQCILLHSTVLTKEKVTLFLLLVTCMNLQQCMVVKMLLH